MAPAARDGPSGTSAYPQAAALSGLPPLALELSAPRSLADDRRGYGLSFSPEHETGPSFGSKDRTTCARRGVRRSTLQVEVWESSSRSTRQAVVTISRGDTMKTCLLEAHAAPPARPNRPIVPSARPQPRYNPFRWWTAERPDLLVRLYPK